MIKIKKLNELTDQELSGLFNRFGSDFSEIMIKTVVPIVNDVRARGDEAVIEYTGKFDRVKAATVLAADDPSIPFEALSTGAKEQLAVLTRLACAGLVDGEQGVPIVIDDALGYSDPGRLQRICAAFSVLEHDSQILLLTCTPGRYAIAGAAHVRLG